MTIVKAAAVQISPVLYSREGTTEKVIRKILELGKLGVRFATFPETMMAPDCAPWTARSGGSASWHAGSIIIRWPVTP
jgi:predicted amidohydrolase